MLASRVFQLIFFMGLTALAIFGLAFDASALTLNPQPLGITGMNPKLVASRDGQRIYVLAASPSGQVRKFNTATLVWESGIPNIPYMADIDLGYAPWTCAAGHCWGGPTLAVGESDVLHVVWGELGLNDCDPDNHFNTAVRLLYTQYSGSSWSLPEPIVERVMNADNPECGYQYPSLAEDGAGNMLLSYMHGVYVSSTEPWNEGTHYYTYNDTSEAWRYHGQIGQFASWTHTVGGFGRLVMGYSMPGQDHVAEIDPVTGAVSSNDVIAARTLPPNLLLVGENDLHAFLGGGDCDPDCHSDEVYYNRNTGSGWQYPGSLLITEDPAIFVKPPSGTEYTAIMGLAVTPSGRRLLSFSYAKKLYLVFYDGSAWGAPMEAATGNEVWSQAVSVVGDEYFLVVWSADLKPEAEIWWSLVPTTGIDTPDAGYDAGGPDAGSCTQCPDGCHDLNSDYDHCGRCDKQCLANEICHQGTCMYPSEIDASIPDAALTDGGAADGSQPDDAGLPDDAGVPAPTDAGKKTTGAEPFEYDTVGCGCATLVI